MLTALPGLLSVSLSKQKLPMRSRLWPDYFTHSELSRWTRKHCCTSVKRRAPVHDSSLLVHQCCSPLAAPTST